jgi:hypothetical protein
MRLRHESNGGDIEKLKMPREGREAIPSVIWDPLEKKWNVESTNG